MLERFWSARHGGSLQLALVVDPEALFESMEESLRGLIRRHLHLVLHLREISFSEMMYTPLNSYYSYYSLNSSQSQSGVLETKPPCSSPAPSQFHQAPLEKSNRIKKNSCWRSHISHHLDSSTELRGLGVARRVFRRRSSLYRTRWRRSSRPSQR